MVFYLPSDALRLLTVVLGGMLSSWSPMRFERNLSSRHRLP